MCAEAGKVSVFANRISIEGELVRSKEPWKGYFEVIYIKIRLGMTKLSQFLKIKTVKI